jgi:hypothetical protein
MSRKINKTLKSFTSSDKSIKTQKNNKKRYNKKNQLYIPSEKTKKKLESLYTIVGGIKKSLVKGSIFQHKNVEKTKFQGNGEDLFFAFDYLKRKKKYNNMLYIPMGDLNDNYIMWKILSSWKCEDKGKFKLTLPKSKKKFINDIQNIFNSKNGIIKFILLPVYLGSSDCDTGIGHFNIAIVDVRKKTFERFEPYGYDNNLTIHRPFNDKMVKIFKEAGIKLKIIEPNKIMPKYSFQDIEEEEIENSIASVRMNDPEGFCGAWSVWYIELVMRNRHLKRKQMIKKAIKEIGGIKDSFRTFIRNYSVHLNRYRKKELVTISEDCGKSLDIISYSDCTKKYIEKKYRKKLSF